MRRPAPRLAGTLATAALAALLVFPASAAATTNEPIAQTGGMTTTLPLFGVSLTVDVTLDTVGNISGVVLTPPGDFTQTTSEATRVKFTNSAGTTTVAVRAKGDSLSTSAKTGSLAGLLGSGTWAADVFATGTRSSVPYTIGDDAGKPTLVIGPVAAAPGVDAVINAPKSDSDDDGASVSGGVTFARDGYLKKLRMTVSVDEDGEAHLKITLSGKDRQRLTGTLAELTGPRTWSAHLCDGTAVTVNYHVGPEAAAMYDSATGGTVAVKPYDHGFQATFNGTKVGVKVGLKANEDGTYTVVAKGFSGSCGGRSGDHGSLSSGHSSSSGESGSRLGSDGRRSGDGGDDGDSGDGDDGDRD